MKRMFKVLVLAMVITAILVVALAGTALAAGNGYMEPAPSSGDGIPDGSGFDRDVGSGLDLPRNLVMVFLMVFAHNHLAWRY